MKKFLLSLAAVAMVSGFASAKTIYWDNSETDWANVYAHSWNPATTWPGEKVTKTIEIDGKTYYAAEIDDAKAEIIFNAGNNMPQTVNLKATADAVYGAANVKGGEGSIDPLGSIKDGVFTPAGAVEITYATIYVPVSEYNYSVAYIYSWNPEIFGGWPGTAMTKATVNGTEYWSVKVDDRKLATVEGWQLNGGSDENKTADLPGVEFKGGMAYNLDGTSVEVGQGGGEDPDPVPDAKSYKLHGQITGNENWETIDLVNNNGVWEYTGSFVAGEFGLQIYEDGANTGWIGGAATVTAAGVAYDFVDGANSTSTLEGEFTFSYNPANSTIKFTKFEGELEHNIAYAIRGTIVTGEWDDYAMAEQNGAWVATLKVVPGQFGIKMTDNGAQKGWFAAADGESAMNGIGNYQAAGIGGTNWESTLEGEYVFSFNPETEVLSVTRTSGVADIEAAEQLPAVYYNLQGVRVENPANGLFLEVRGNQVRKVAVK